MSCCRHPRPHPRRISAQDRGAGPRHRWPRKPSLPPGTGLDAVASTIDTQLKTLEQSTCRRYFDRVPLIDEIQPLPVITRLNYRQRQQGEVTVPDQWHFRSTTRPGVLPNDIGIYFLVSGESILKVGKAAGRRGISGRIKKYETYYNPNQTDDSVILWYAQMHGEGQGPLQGVVLDVRFFSVQPVHVDIPWPAREFQLPAHPVDALEQHFIARAKGDGHQLSLGRD